MSEPTKNQNAKKQRLSPRAQGALVVVGLLVFAAAGWFLLVSPKRSEARELQAEVEAVQAQIDDRRSRALAPPPPAIRAAELFRLAKAIPDKTDMSGVILELNRIATETGIEFETISPQPAVSQGPYQVLPINLVFDGNYYGLSDFLYRLRNLVSVRNGKLNTSGRLFLVDTISFDRSEREFPFIKASLVVDAFVFGTGTAPAAAPIGATPAPAATTPPATATTTTTTTTAPATTTPSAPAPAPSTSAAPAAGGS